LREALRDVGDGEAPLPRLVSSLREAKAISDLTPSAERVVLTGFDANLEKVTGGGLSDFRIIHFATHGIFDDERPELSGLVLSRVDERGRRRDGFLRTDDVYNLHLNADLVVLSACRTGLGHNVNGEGILGITRGFMYAGSRSVIASLWKVNDEATAELMGRFYYEMFRKGLPPSAALRDAKEQMWRQERWRSPYFWAAFEMQGEGAQPLPAVADVHDRAPLLLAVALPALAAAAFLTLRSVRRHKAARA
jgi:CHAT domain-containing protein